MGDLIRSLHPVDSICRITIREDCEDLPAGSNRSTSTNSGPRRDSSTKRTTAKTSTSASRMAGYTLRSLMDHKD